MIKRTIDIFIKFILFAGASLLLLQPAGASGRMDDADDSDEFNELGDIEELIDSVVKAPIVPDGNVAGRSTDIVINLDVEMDPTAAGLSLMAGDSVTITLPDAFVNNGLPVHTPFSAGCAPPFPDCSTAILLQGWPQHPLGVPPPSIPGKWSVAEGATPNEIVITALVDLLANPPAEPGLKQIHLFLNGFTNPHPGHYRIGVEMSTGESGSARVKIVPKARPSINVVSVFAPGAPNTVFQQISIGGAALPYNFLIWVKDGVPGEGITIANGQLMQGNRSIGKVSIEAPSGAVGQDIMSLGSSTLLPVFPLTGKPAGRLQAQFMPGSVPGIYRVRLHITGGNKQTMQVRVTP